MRKSRIQELTKDKVKELHLINNGVIRNKQTKYSIFSAVKFNKSEVSVRPMSGLMRILTHRSKILSTVAHEEIKFPLSDRTEELFNKTIDVLRYNDGVYAKNGLAISANQIGSLKRFFVISDLTVKPLGRKVQIICNPEVLESSTETEDFLEGCLSIPKWQCLVNRPKECLIKYQDYNGNVIKTEFQGFVARIMMHEIDHLNGVTMLDKKKTMEINPLYTDYLKRRKRERLAKKKEAEVINSPKLETIYPEDF